MARAWVLNLDANDELARPDGYRTDARTEAILAAQIARVGPLLDEGDVLVYPRGAAGGGTAAAFGLHGCCWCPTPSALSRLRESGALVPLAPPPSVLREVNHRAFATTDGPGLPGARFCADEGEVESVIGGDTPTGKWLLKRAFSYTGRGHRAVSAGALDGAARAWVRASLSSGDGLQVEPLVEREGDYAIHGYLDRAGLVTRGLVTTQTCDARGVWQGSRVAAGGELRGDERKALLTEVEGVGRRLASRGYFGPFGIDAFRYRWGGEARFQPRSDVNARYSMGWAIGMAGRRVDRAHIAVG